MFRFLYTFTFIVIIVKHSNQDIPLLSDMHLHACIQCNHIFKPSRQTLHLQATSINPALCIECWSSEHMFAMFLYGTSGGEENFSVFLELKVIWQLLATPKMIIYAAASGLLARGQEAINPHGREHRLTRECAIQTFK